MLHDAGNFRREHYYIVLSFKNIYLRPLLTAEVFLFYAKSILTYEEIKKDIIQFFKTY